MVMVLQQQVILSPLLQLCFLLLHEDH